MASKCILSFSIISCMSSLGAATVFNVKDYGAVGDNVTDDTESFVSVINEIDTEQNNRAAVGNEMDDSPSVLLVPSGGNFLIRPINLTSNMIFHIESGASVIGKMNASEWPVIPGAPSYGQGRNHKGPRYTSLIHGENLVNVTIEGEGPGSVLDGQGQYWWSLPNKNYTRGHLLELMYTENTVVTNMTLRNSPFWTTHFFDCDNVHVHHVAVEAPTDSPNTDGFDPDSSRNVLVEHSSYIGGDDCVAIKSGWDCFGVEYNKSCSNIHIRNLTCDGPEAGVAIGSEMSGGVENVLVEDITYVTANGVAHIKWGASRGGFIKNVTFRNVLATTELSIGLQVDGYYGASNPSCAPLWVPPHLTQVEDLNFINIDASAAVVTDDVFKLLGLPTAPANQLYFENVKFKSDLSKLKEWSCFEVEGNAKNNTVTPWPPCQGIEVV